LCVSGNNFAANAISQVRHFPHFTYYNSPPSDGLSAVQSEDKMSRHSKRRIPKLAFTKTQDIGWHVNYRDPVSGVPRRKRFGLLEREEALGLYNKWLSER
jgi:hypothetical protein